jgi:hypothetical protein
MLPPPGAPDVLTLATVAYKLYDTYQGAPERLKGLREDIRGLEIVLKRLANRLIIQEGGLPEKERDELEEVEQQVRNVLEELQQNVPSSKLTERWTRFKWSQQRVDSIRLRITSLCGQIAAFNACIVPSPTNTASTASTASSEQLILSTLDDILINVQNLRRPDSMITLVAENGNVISSDRQGQDLWEDLMQEMEKHGISETQVNDHREMILRWIARAASAGLLNQPFDEPLAMPEDIEETWEVISAVYGPAIVTSPMQHIFDVYNKKKEPSVIQFTVANVTFGTDPFPGNVKGFSMVWRQTRRRGRKVSHSAPMKLFAHEGLTVTIDLSFKPAYNDNEDDAAGGGIRIINASWHNQDVTERVSTLVRNGQYTVMATNVELLTSDPCPEYLKVLSVTWTYLDGTHSLSQFSVSTACEYGYLNIPPRLNILCADWAGMDITTVLRSRISQEQTLNLDTNTLVVSVLDPWPNFHKAISIIYQYGSGPLELLLARDGAGLVVIKPYKTVRQSYKANLDPWRLDHPIGNDTTVLVIIWGLRPMPDNADIRRALREGSISCTNDFFGVDGWKEKVKTCQVFLRNNRTGETSCITGKENSILKLPSTPPTSA